MDVGRLFLYLITGPQPHPSIPDGGHHGDMAPRRPRVLEPEVTAVSPIVMIEASLLRDESLAPQARITLVETFKSLYQMAADLSQSEAKP
jgi:hypothetical protein